MSECYPTARISVPSKLFTSPRKPHCSTCIKSTKRAIYWNARFEWKSTLKCEANVAVQGRDIYNHCKKLATLPKLATLRKLVNLLKLGALPVQYRSHCNRGEWPGLEVKIESRAVLLWIQLSTEVIARTLMMSTWLEMKRLRVNVFYLYAYSPNVCNVTEGIIWF